MTQKENAKQFPKTYYCRHMLPGVIAYEANKAKDIAAEMIWIDADAIKVSSPSMVNKPIYVFHQPVDLENIHEADGFVVENFYNELDGWGWAKMLIVSDEGHQAVQRKWSVSNAYIPKEWDGAGQHLSVDYNRKIRNYEYTHLAIVPNPRYEEAKIYTTEEFKVYQAEKKAQLEELQNSKPTNKENGIMFFRNKREDIKAGDAILDTDFTEIKNADGTTEVVTVGDLKKAKEAENKALKENAKKNEKMVDDDEEIEVDGEKVNMDALKECYKNMKSMKKNADDEEEEKKKKAEEAKENAKNGGKTPEQIAADKAAELKIFNELQNAHNKKAAVSVDLGMDKAARGQKRYGSSSK